MKLSKIYSNDERFRTIKFNDGLNVILGNLTDTAELDRNSHNLGKSILVELIDFMLLKELKKGHFLKEHEDKFNNHVFYLEVKFGEFDFLTIRRKIKTPSKIDFKLHKDENQDFTNEPYWDFDNLPLTSKDPEKNPKIILNNKWGFRVTLPFMYRYYINYFLRTQYDYDAVFKLSKHRGADSKWKTPLAFLLGFDGSVLENKYEIERKLEKEKERLLNLEIELQISLNDLSRLKSLLDVTEQKRDFVKEKIDNFDFYFTERELNKSLIDEVETRISELNSLEYKIKYEIRQIQTALTTQNKFSIERVSELFREVNLIMPDKIVKSYDELINFNKRITDERNKYLVGNLKENQSELETVLEELRQLNDKRNDILSVLREKDSFNKFKRYQMELVEVENEISNILSKLDNYDALKAIAKRIQKLTKDLSNSILALKEHIDMDNDVFKSIQKDFTNLSKRILSESAILYHRINGNDNVDFIADITGYEESGSSSNALTAKADGFSYKKMLCVCFDLAILINYRQKNFFEFVYHDGSLESMANTKRITYLNTVRSVCNSNNVQYILTALEDHIPEVEPGKKFELTDDEIVITLNNEANDKGRLFGFSF